MTVSNQPFPPSFLNKIYSNQQLFIFKQVFTIIIEQTLESSRALFKKYSNNINELVLYFCKIVKGLSNSNNAEILITKLKKLNDLLKNITKHIPKNWKLITKLIELNLIFCEVCKLVRPHIRSVQPVMFLQDDQDDYIILVDIIQQWLKKECSEDIQVTFGVKERNQKDIEMFEELQKKRVEEKFRRLHRQRSTINDDNDENQMIVDMDESQIDSDNEVNDNNDALFGEDYFQRSQYMYEHARGSRQPQQQQQQQQRQKVSYIGLSDEPALYNYLLSMDLTRLTNYRQKFQDFLNIQVINTRLSNSIFESLVSVRSKIDLIVKKFQINTFKIDTVIDRAIIEQLLKASKSMTNQKDKDKIANEQIEKLVEIISDKKLLQQYFSLLINDSYARIEKTTSILQDYTKEKQFSVHFNNTHNFGGLSSTGDSRTQTDQQGKYLILKIVLNWPQFSLIYEKNFNQKKEILDDGYSRKIGQWIELFLKTLEGIVRGDESFVYIRLIKSNTENFIALLQRLKQLQHPIQFYTSLINARSIEIDEFESYYKSLKKFINLCRNYSNTCNLKAYEDILERFYKEIDYNLYIFKPLNRFIKTLSAAEIQKGLGGYNPVVIFFPGIDTATMVEIQKINSLQRNNCVRFDEYFLDECKKQVSAKKTQQIDVKCIIQNVWPATVKRWYLIAKSIESGEIKLNEIDGYLTYYRSKEKMLSEFEYICGYFNVKNYQLRREQINLYFRFKTSVTGARKIETIRDQLKLKRKFNELDPLLEISSDESKEWNLLKMNEQVRKTVDILAKLNSDERLKCLTVFVESHELVEWLRKNTGDIMGLKFLVDLASASTNEPNADRDLLARALKDAGTAFAPLIYDLKLEDNFHKFMEHCEKVWLFLEEDTHVSDKLFEIRNKIELLDEIKQKGNVEVSSIKQAKLFNEKGIYSISLNNKIEIREINERKDSSSSHVLSEKQIENATKKEDSIEYILLLKYEEEVDVYDDRTKMKIGKKQETKRYTYSQLKDQQNILMLMAKKNTIMTEEDDETKTLEYFLEIFDGITRLAELYLKLLRNGCILFNKFEAVVYCDILNDREKMSKPVSTITFHVDLNNHEINDLNSTSKQSLVDLCSFMENCFTLWQEYVVDLREKHDCLNYMTINQIVFLREKLGSLFLTKKINDIDFVQIKWLLMNINTDVSVELLLKACNEAAKSVSKNVSNVKLTGYDDKITEFMNRFARDNDFPVQIVRRAIDEYGIADESKLLAYCVEHENDDVQN
jgi:hypothetical protein